ncbi:MAG: nitroreductase family protein [Trueperaceae bacterium]|nr:nitroreductase family protein [Trueperaceae bacterium]
MNKSATTRIPIHEFLSERWSPRAFSSEAFTQEDVLALFEAARWAPSGLNSQPWRFIYATHANPEAFETLADCLNPSNKRWAEKAFMLVAVVVEQQAPGAESPNGSAEYAAGLAVASLVFEATARGLACRQMGGINRDKVRETYQIPEGYNPRVILALGKPGKLEDLPEELQERERTERSRKALEEIVFEEAWGNAAKL